MEDNRQTMTRRLQEAQFALLEAALFLDTHPNDQQALTYRREKMPQYHELRKQYEARFSPLTHLSANQDSWRWIDSPWPWE